MRLYCEKCHEIFPVDPEQKGSEVACPNCGEKQLCPTVSAAPGVVLGDFLILKSITSGGMGEVFVARQLSLDREVALKVLLEKFNQSPEYAEALLHEARAAAKLNHPNIVQAYAVGQEDGVLFFAMELIRGETCKELLKRKKRLDGLEAAKIILDIARALDTAWNAQKIVHQDIKPENIMLDASGYAKLADLGLARSAGSDSDSNSDEVMGTPQYISPEQLTGVPTDVRSDIYSLGATFYHLVTGRFPYVAPTTDEIVRMHVDGKLQPPIEVYDHLSVELNRIILKMMARQIEQRYQDPKELIADLEAFVHGENVEMTRPVKIRRPWSRRKKQIVFGGGGILLILLLLSVLIVGTVFAASPAMPEFARNFFLKCRQTVEKTCIAVRDYFAPVKEYLAPEKVPVVENAKVVEYTGREDLIQTGNALLRRLRRGEQSPSLLREVDEFYRKYAPAKTKKERGLMQEIVAASGKADEALYQEPARRKGRMQYQANVRAAAVEREKARALAADEARRKKAQTEAEKARALENQRRQEAEAKAKALAEKKRLAEKAAQAEVCLRQSAQSLWHDFLVCAETENREKFERQLARPVMLPPEIAYADVKEQMDFFDHYREALKTMFADYVLFRAQLKDLGRLGISVSIPRYGICYILSLSPQQKGHFRTIRGVEFDFSLGEQHRAETMHFLNVLGRKLGWDAEKKSPAFYYALYTRRLTPAAIKLAPGDFWKKFGEPMKLEFPAVRQ